MSSSRRTLDVGELLTIDVGSELRKLASAQLQGSWQLPAELVRHAMRAGARDVRVTLQRGRAELTTGTPVITRDQLEDLVELADREAPPSRRHEALLRLENTGGPGLLSLVGLSPQRLEVITRDETQGTGLALRLTPGRRGVIEPVNDASGTHIAVIGVRMDRGRAREWLTDVARFAAAKIEVDGKEVTAGFGRVMSRTRVRGQPRVEVAIPYEGDVARVWLLMNGVVATHASVSPAPCFEAAIEMSTLVEHNATPADLRAAFDQTVPDLVHDVVMHLCELAARIERLPPAARARVRELALEAARMRRYDAVMEVPLFEGRDADGNDRWFSLSEIAGRLSGANRSLAVLSPRQDPEQYVIDDLVLFLEETQRASLARLMDVTFHPPRHRDELRRRGPFGQLQIRELRRRWAHTLTTVFWRPTAVPADALSSSEARFLADLRGVVGRPGDVIETVAFVEGTGPVRHAGARLWLPRQNAEVVAAVARHAGGDVAHVYPCAMAWLAGIQPPRVGARTAWRAAHEPRLPRA